jgi:hypothetical protein
MTIGAAIGNLSWFAASLPEYNRFKHDAANIKEAQQAKLKCYLGVNADTAFGRQHDFAAIQTFEDYARRVPIRSYDEFAPWIAKIADGEKRVLTADPVRLFEPTSGSSGPSKLIPFTDSLQREIRQAVAAWSSRNFLSYPRLLPGRAYWSITPQMSNVESESTAVPVGFDEDSAYLGGLTEKLINMTLATDPRLKQEQDIERFWEMTLLMLLRCRDLRLISVWHPSFLSLLIERLRNDWQHLLQELAREDGRRAGELGACGADDLCTIWPELRVISCWADAHAATSIPRIRQLFPNVVIQPKGLIATEGVVTVPIGGQHPLAVRSHVYEFLDDNDNALAPWQLQKSEEYSVVITTGGGLYRYRMGDKVMVDGFYREVPSLRFLGREDRVSDHFGEKLSEAFVGDVIGRVATKNSLSPEFAMLALEDDRPVPAYVLYLQTDDAIHDRLERHLERELCANPHYELCVRLGQLGPARIAAIRGNGFDIYSARLSAKGMKLGDIKPTPLSLHSGWRRLFSSTG